MLRSLEEVQMFLLASLEENRELAEVNLIYQALIKLSYTGGFYMKALEIWNDRAVGNRRKWTTFRRVMVVEYEHMLAEGAGTTMQQEGYVMALHAKEELRNGESLTDTIMKYAKRARLSK